LKDFIKYDEGETILIIPKESLTDHQPPKVPAFFNPKGKEIRDIAVLVHLAYSKLSGAELRLADPLAGVGAKALRLVKEAGIRKAYLNDLNTTAIRASIEAAKLNGIDDRVEFFNEEANLFLSRFSGPRKRFEAIDVDPFGSPIPFIDSALRAIRNGGLLSVTATDTTVLNGLYPRIAKRRYMGRSARTDDSKEIGLRLLISGIAWRAASLDIALKPIFCHASHHYMRCYFQVRRSALEADKLIDLIGTIRYCTSCGYKTLEGTESCPNCGSKMREAGPIWLSSIHEAKFLQSVLDEAKRRGVKAQFNLFLRAYEEVDLPPYYHSISWICDKIQVSTPSPDKVVSEIRKEGYKASRSSIDPTGIKTDAPYALLLSIIRKLSFET
jgi:tRNA (guanine26-N2/guanine27-N2)-dimethyltransferase